MSFALLNLAIWLMYYRKSYKCVYNIIRYIQSSLLKDDTSKSPLECSWILSVRESRAGKKKLYRFNRAPWTDSRTKFIELIIHPYSREHLKADFLQALRINSIRNILKQFNAACEYYQGRDTEKLKKKKNFSAFREWCIRNWAIKDKGVKEAIKIARNGCADPKIPRFRKVSSS